MQQLKRQYDLFGCAAVFSGFIVVWCGNRFTSRVQRIDTVLVRRSALPSASVSVKVSVCKMVVMRVREFE